VENKNSKVRVHKRNSRKFEKLSRLAKVTNLESYRLNGPFGQVGGAKVECSEKIKTNAEAERFYNGTLSGFDLQSSWRYRQQSFLHLMPGPITKSPDQSS
jgi:hypothetical protein